MLEARTAIEWYTQTAIGLRQNYIAALDKGESAYYHLIRRKQTEDTSSNMTLPITTISVNRLVPKLVSFVFPRGAQFFISAGDKRLNKRFQDVTRPVKLRRSMKKWIRRALVDGVGVAYPYWEDRYEYIKDPYYFDASIEELTLIGNKNKDIRRDLFLQIFGQSVNQWEFKKDSSSAIEAVMYDDIGNLSKYNIEFRALPHEIEMSVIGDRLVYSGLKIDIIPIRNLYFLVDSPSFDRAPYVMYQQFSTVEDLWYFCDDKEKLLSAKGKQYDIAGPRSPAEGVITRLGERVEQTTQSPLVELWQVFYKNKIAFVLPCSLYTIMEIDLEDEFPRREELPRRPLFTIKFLEINDRTVFGWSLPLLLYHYQKEMDYLNNLTNDIGDLSSAMFGGYKPAKFTIGEPKKITLERNVLLPIESKDDLFFYNVAPNIQWAVQKMFMLSQEVERLTQIDEMTLGRGNPAGAGRGERTLGGMQLLYGQKQEVFMEMATDMREEFDSLLTSMLFLWSRRASALELKNIGFNRNTLTSANVYVDTDIASAQQEMNRMMSLYQLFRDPLLLQLGIIKPQGFVTILSDVIKAFGKDPEDFLQQLEPRDPQQDIDTLKSGGMPVPGLMDNHQAHIQAEMAEMNKSGMEIRNNIMQHIQLHAAMMEQLQSMPNEMTAGKYPVGKSVVTG